MKNYRLSAVILILLLSLQSFAFASDSQAESPQALAGGEAEAVTAYILGDSFFSGERVTRAEFTGALVECFKIGTDNSFEKVYEDVDESNAYWAQILAAYKAGIISPAVNFEPDSPILFEQAVKMVVVAIGYGNIGEYYGGYPSGYIKAANSLKLMKNVEAGTEGMSPNAVKELLYNLLTARVEFAGITDDTVKYEKGGEDYMQSVHGLFSAEGIVTGTEYNSYRAGTAITGSGYLEIDGFGYKCDITTPHMLGLNVQVYYDKEKNVEIIIPADNEELFFDGDDAASFENGRFSYYNENERLKTVDVSGASVVYNGRIMPGFTLADLKGDYAKFRLVNNDGDRNYEYVFVYDYTYLYVDTVDTRNNSVSDENGFVYLFDAEPHDTKALISDADGTVLELADIKSDELLCVAKSADNKLAIISKCGTPISGKISSIAEDEVEINGVMYSISPYAAENYASSIAVGAAGTFIIGNANDVAVITASADVMSYGYLIDGIVEPGMDSRVLIKLLTNDGKIRIYPALRVSFDGGSYVEDNILAPLTENGEVVPQLIRYKTDEEDANIVNIDLAETGFDFESEPVSEKDSLRKYTFVNSSGAPVTSFNYRSGGVSCAPYFNVDGTVVFRVPEDSEVKNADVSEFVVTGSEALSSNRNYSFEVYDLSEQGSAGVVVLKGEQVLSRRNCIVESALRGLLPDGDEGYVLHVYGNKAYTTYYLKGEDAAPLGKTLQGGDVIELVAGDGNIITDIALVYDASGAVPVPNTEDSSIRFEVATNVSYFHGALYSKGSSYGYLSKTTDGSGNFTYDFENLINLKLDTENMVLINKNRDEIRPVTLSELKDYKTYGNDNYYVVAYMSYQAPGSVYVYER